MQIMSSENKMVAVVDDDPEMRSAMARLLRGLGYDAWTFDSAKTFLNCASRCKAICLVVDIQLGDICGIDLACRLAAEGFKFPIIFMTGCDDAMARKKAHAAGGIAFLRKPFSPEILVEAIRRATGLGEVAPCPISHVVTIS
jgi:FixJ family two-component response regulator